MGAIRMLQTMDEDELYVYAKEIRAPVELVRQTKHLGRLPVVNFAAGGVATPADAALMMQLGMDGVFVGSGIFKSGDPASRARAIVQVGDGPRAGLPSSRRARAPCARCAGVSARGLLVAAAAAHPLTWLVPSLPQAVTHYNNPKVIAEVSKSLGEPMVGIDVREAGFNSYASRSE
jgi:pyridoxal 5'-phosphate synthase pdxS subunit